MLNKFGKNGAPFAMDEPYTRNGRRVNHSAQLLRVETPRQRGGTNLHQNMYRMRCAKNAGTNNTRKMLALVARYGTPCRKKKITIILNSL
jgi:hypothetical protein